MHHEQKNYYHSRYKYKVSSTFNNNKKPFDLWEMDEGELREGPRIFVLKESWLAILPEVQSPATNAIITIIFRHFIFKEPSPTSGRRIGHKVNLNFFLWSNLNMKRKYKIKTDLVPSSISTIEKSITIDTSLSDYSNTHLMCPINHHDLIYYYIT